MLIARMNILTVSTRQLLVLVLFDNYNGAPSQVGHALTSPA